MGTSSSPLRTLVDRHRGEIIAASRRHNARAVSVFGSVARNEDHSDSDIDFLVEFEDHSSLFDLDDLTTDLAELLGVGVDVVSTGGLLDRDDAIRREAIAL